MLVESSGNEGDTLESGRGEVGNNELNKLGGKRLELAKDVSQVTGG